MQPKHRQQAVRPAHIYWHFPPQQSTGHKVNIRHDDRRVHIGFEGVKHQSIGPEKWANSCITSVTHGKHERVSETKYVDSSILTYF